MEIQGAIFLAARLAQNSWSEALGLKSWKKRKAVRSVDTDPTSVNASLKQKTHEEPPDSVSDGEGNVWEFVFRRDGLLGEVRRLGLVWLGTLPFFRS